MPSSSSRTDSSKILVVFPGALGDFICFLPALTWLARGDTLDLMARSEYASLTPSTVYTSSVECREISRLFVAGAEDDDTLKTFFGSYRCIYSWMGSRQPEFVRRLQVLSHGKLHVFPFRPSRSRIHISHYYLSCLGVNSKGAVATVPLHPEALDWSCRLWRQRGLYEHNILALAPGSGAKGKNWPAEFYRIVARWWEKKFRGKVLVALGPAEEDRKETEGWSDDQLIRGLDLAKLAALLVRCHSYVGNDSGITHLAAATGIETFALFGPTDPRQWAPRGNKVTVITPKHNCSLGANFLETVRSDCECLKHLSPFHVSRRIEQRLRKSRWTAHLDKTGGSD